MLEFKSAKRRYALLFVLLFFITLAFYWKARGGVFTFDMLDWVKRYDELGIKGFLVNYDDVSFRPFIHLLMFSGYSVFGVNPEVAIIISCLFHSFNALMLIWFCHHLGKKNQFSFIALLIGFIFLLSPYQTEVVVWGVGFLYSSLLALFWIMIWAAYYYSVTSIKTYLILHISAFIAAVFTHELAFVFPVAMIVLLLLTYEAKSRRVLLLIQISMTILLLLAYLLLNKIILGVWIGHYGAKKHLQFDINALITTFSGYFLKFLVLLNWWKNPVKDKVFLTIGRHPLEILMFLAVCVVALLLLLKQKREFKFIIASLFIYVLLLFPVLNLYFLSWIPIHGDRLGYLPSPFFYLAICLALFALEKHIGYIYCTCLLLGSVISLNSNTRSWENAGTTMQNLEATFPELAKRKAIILACADNYNGAYMYRSRVNYPFSEALRIKSNRDYTKQTTEILGYNMTKKDDSLIVSVIDSLTLNVKFAQWGNWWWRDKAGATSFKTKMYEVTVDNWGHSFVIHFNEKPDDVVYLYQSKDSWKTVANF